MTPEVRKCTIQSTKHHDVSLNSQNLYLHTPSKFGKKSNEFLKNEIYISILCDIEIFSYYTFNVHLNQLCIIKRAHLNFKNEIENVYCIECQVN